MGRKKSGGVALHRTPKKVRLRVRRRGGVWWLVKRKGRWWQYLLCHNDKEALYAIIEWYYESRQ